MLRLFPLLLGLRSVRLQVFLDDLGAKLVLLGVDCVFAEVGIQEIKFVFDEAFIDSGRLLNYGQLHFEVCL